MTLLDLYSLGFVLVAVAVLNHLLNVWYKNKAKDWAAENGFTEVKRIQVLGCWHCRSKGRLLSACLVAKNETDNTWYRICLFLGWDMFSKVRCTHMTPIEGEQGQ